VVVVVEVAMTLADGVYGEGLLRAGNPAKGPRACVRTKGSVRVI